LLPIGDRFLRAPVSHLKIENFQGSAAGIHLVVMGEIGEAFEDAEQFHAPGPAQDLHIARPARRAEWLQPRKVVASCGAGETVKPLMRAPDEVPGSCRPAPVLAEPDADPVAVAPDGIEQQREVTTKEGILDETILIMVVDKSATITVNSHVRLGSLSS